MPFLVYQSFCQEITACFALLVRWLSMFFVPIFVVPYVGLLSVIARLSDHTHSEKRPSLQKGTS